MDILKIVLAVVGLIALAVGALWLVGIVSALLWIAIWVAAIGAIGYGGYKLLLAKPASKAQLPEKRTMEIADLKDTDKALEEYKRRLLPK